MVACSRLGGKNRRDKGGVVRFEECQGREEKLGRAIDRWKKMVEGIRRELDENGVVANEAVE